MCFCIGYNIILVCVSVHTCIMVHFRMSARTLLVVYTVCFLARCILYIFGYFMGLTSFRFPSRTAVVPSSSLPDILKPNKFSRFKQKIIIIKTTKKIKQLKLTSFQSGRKEKSIELFNDKLISKWGTSFDLQMKYIVHFTIKSVRD